MISNYIILLGIGGKLLLMSQEDHQTLDIYIYIYTRTEPKLKKRKTTMTETH